MTQGIAILTSNLWHTWQLFKWFKGEVVDGTRRVLYRDSYSKVNALYSGVPQGSVLRPLL